jgi:hypothetical protein
MAVFAVSITKTIPWRGKETEFSNVYHYVTDPLEVFPDNEVIDKLVAAEKAISTGAVKFVKAHTWGPTEQGQQASKMREVRALTGIGTSGSAITFYSELAVMIYWPLGRYGSKNRPQYLRKWLHLGRAAGLPADGSRSTQATPADIQSYIDSVRTVIVPSKAAGFGICNWRGDHEPKGPGIMYPFLEHRQLGR